MLLLPPSLPHDRVFPAPGAHLCGMAWDGSHLWHSDADSERIYRLDPETGRILGDLPCPAVRTDLVYDGRYLWQIADHPKRIVVVDPKDGHLVREMSLGDSENACGLHVEPDRYRTGWKIEATIEERDRDSHRTLTTYPAMPRIAGLTKTAQRSLVHRLEEGLLVGIDLPSGMEIARLQLEGNPTGLCWDGSRFWYSDYSGRRICGVRLDEE